MGSFFRQPTNVPPPQQSYYGRFAAASYLNHYYRSSRLPSLTPARDGDEMSPLWWSSLAGPLIVDPGCGVRLQSSVVHCHWAGFVFVGSLLPGTSRFEAVHVR